MTTYTFTIRGAPPSVNRTNQHWLLRHRAHRDWYEIVAAHALGLHIPRPAFPSAIVEIELHSKRKRDVGNIEKLILDALVACGILKDDSFPHLRETRLRARRAARDEVVITVREAPKE